MSVRALFWATQQNLPAMQKIVLIMIADRLNQNTGACYPSLDTLATDCGMARRSVINQIVKLETAGLLSVERSNEDHVKQNNHYHLPTTPSVGANNTPVVNVMHGGGESSSAKVVNEVHLKQNNITKKPTTTAIAKPSLPASDSATKSRDEKIPNSRGGYISGQNKTATALDIDNNIGANTGADSDLIFPGTFSPQETSAAENILHSVGDSDRQPMLDVLMAAIEANDIRKSAIACLGGMARRYYCGTFDPTPGDKVRARRQQRSINQQRMAKAETVNHEQIMAQLNTLAKSKPQAKQAAKKHPPAINELQHIRRLLSRSSAS